MKNTIKPVHPSIAIEAMSVLKEAYEYVQLEVPSKGGGKRTDGRRTPQPVCNSVNAAKLIRAVLTDVIDMAEGKGQYESYTR